MTKNIGGMEQMIRLVLGVLALGMAVFGGLPTWAVVVTGVVGVVALVTGSLKYCPVWTLFGVNTCPLRNQAKE